GGSTAIYGYEPFGKALRATGYAATSNPLRFSTQFTDDLDGTVKYLYRPCRPTTGKWLSRDPIGEKGGKNEFAFVANEPCRLSDRLGLAIGMADYPPDCACRVKSFEITSKDWLGNLPMPAWQTATHYQKQAKVDFKLELLAGSNKKYCVIKNY